MFDQLLTRGENCQKVIEQLIQLSPQQSYYHKVLIPKAEILLIQEALKLDKEGDMEDLIGNLQRYALFKRLFLNFKKRLFIYSRFRAANLYIAAKKLVTGVTLTYLEEDAKKVRNQLKSFGENVENKLAVVQQKIRQLKGTTYTNSSKNNTGNRESTPISSVKSRGNSIRIVGIPDSSPLPSQEKEQH